MLRRGGGGGGRTRLFPVGWMIRMGGGGGPEGERCVGGARRVRLRVFRRMGGGRACKLGLSLRGGRRRLSLLRRWMRGGILGRRRFGLLWTRRGWRGCLGGGGGQLVLLKKGGSAGRRYGVLLFLGRRGLGWLRLRGGCSPIHRWRCQQMRGLGCLFRRHRRGGGQRLSSGSRFRKTEISERVTKPARRRGPGRPDDQSHYQWQLPWCLRKGTYCHPQEMLSGREESEQGSRFPSSSQQWESLGIPQTNRRISGIPSRRPIPASLGRAVPESCPHVARLRYLEGKTRMKASNYCSDWCTGLSPGSISSNWKGPGFRRGLPLVSR